jgi:hypothetical protein
MDALNNMHNFLIKYFNSHLYLTIARDKIINMNN